MLHARTHAQVTMAYRGVSFQQASAEFAVAMAPVTSPPEKVKESASSAPARKSSSNEEGAGGHGHGHSDEDSAASSLYAPALSIAVVGATVALFI